MGNNEQLIDTSEFYSHLEINSEDVLEVRNSISLHVLLSVVLFSSLTYLIYSFNIINDKILFLVIIMVLTVFFIYSLYKIFDRSPKIIISSLGIYIKSYNKKYKWNEIKSTLIKIITRHGGDTMSTEQYLLIKVNNKLVEVDLKGLDFSYEEIANFIENFKIRYS